MVSVAAHPRQALELVPVDGAAPGTSEWVWRTRDGRVLALVAGGRA